MVTPNVPDRTAPPTTGGPAAPRRGWRGALALAAVGIALGAAAPTASATTATGTTATGTTATGATGTAVPPPPPGSDDIAPLQPGEPWPLDAFVVRYRLDDRSAWPTFVASMVFEVGRVGDGIPAVSVWVTYPNGEEDSIRQAISTESWNAGLQALPVGGLDSDDDCSLATQWVTVHYGGEDVGYACSGGIEPHEPWLHFLDPFSRDLPDFDGPGDPTHVDDVTEITYLVVDGETSNPLTVARHIDGTAITHLVAGDDGAAGELVGALDADAWEELAAMVLRDTAAFVDCPPNAPMSSVQLTTHDEERTVSWCAADDDPLTRAFAEILTDLLRG